MMYRTVIYVYTLSTLDLRVRTIAAEYNINKRTKLTKGQYPTKSETYCTYIAMAVPHEFKGLLVLSHLQQHLAGSLLSCTSGRHLQLQ